MTACFSEQKEAKKLCFVFKKCPESERVEELLARAVLHVMTPAEIAAQRRSYVLAEIAIGDDADEAAYAAALTAGDAEQCAALLAEGAARAARAAVIYDARHPS